MISTNSDTYGAIVSGACLVHCLLTPLLFILPMEFTLLPIGGSLVFYLLEITFLVLSFLAVYYSAKTTSHHWVKYALYASWASLSILIVNEQLAIFQWNEMLHYLPAIALIGLHLFNRKQHKCHTQSCNVSRHQ